MTNIMRQRYSDDDTEDDAFDSRGVLRDGRTTRVSMQTRDASRRKARESDMLRDVNVNNRARVTTRIVDGNGNGGLALNRPGYRINTGDSSARQKSLADAYAADSAYQRNRYKCADGERLCGKCHGEGFINGEQCPACYGSGVVDDGDDNDFDDRKRNQPRNDGSVIHQTTDHATMMNRLYSQLDSELQDAWRGK
jgi:hypothetical protein